jgi:hypothetical protein
MFNADTIQNSSYTSNRDTTQTPEERLSKLVSDLAATEATWKTAFDLAYFAKRALDDYKSLLLMEDKDGNKKFQWTQSVNSI